MCGAGYTRPGSLRDELFSNGRRDSFNAAAPFSPETRGVNPFISTIRVVKWR